MKAPLFESRIYQDEFVLSRIANGLRRRSMRDVVNKMRQLLRRSLDLPEVQWCRVIMDQETERYLRALDYSRFRTLEVSGIKWKDFGFADYRSVGFAEYDICTDVLEPEAFDLIIAEQVLEHVLWPYRAVRNVHGMLKPGGRVLVTTPFLLRVHNVPVDCSRWTELGIKYLLAEAGFSLDNILTGSWGNRSCVRANFDKWASWTPWTHSLRNEPEFPVVVWALARKT